MNGNSEGTPNPLNPNPLDANPSESVGGVREVAEINSETAAERPAQKLPISRGTQPLTEELVEESVMVESLDPDGRPMEKVAPTPEPKKRKKTGLIIGMVICLFIAVGCGVAAILLMMNSDKDPVSMAMKKIMSGDAPSNAIIDGDIEFLINDGSSPISKINIDLNAQTKTNSLVNAAEAYITLTLANDEKLNFEFQEVYGADGDLYFRIEGISSLISKIALLQSLSNMPSVAEVNCTGDGDEASCLEIEALDCEAAETCNIADYLVTDVEVISEQDGIGNIFGMLGGIVDVIDGEWLKISMDELTSLTGNATMESDLSCMIGLVDDINTSSNSAAELYNNNPFISSTTNNITIDSKFNPVRQIIIDDEAFANFVNSIQNSNLTSELYDCLGWEGNVQVSAADVAAVVRQIPVVYVEINKDNNFSRLYLNYATDNNAMTATIDLSFSYPTNINISEPDEYTTFEQIIQTIFMSVYDIDNDTTVEEGATHTN